MWMARTSYLVALVLMFIFVSFFFCETLWTRSYFLLVCVVVQFSPCFKSYFLLFSISPYPRTIIGQWKFKPRIKLIWTTAALYNIHFNAAFLILFKGLFSLLCKTWLVLLKDAALLVSTTWNIFLHDIYLPNGKMLCEIEIMIDIDFDMVQWYRSVIAIAQHKRPVTWKAGWI